MSLVDLFRDREKVFKPGIMVRIIARPGIPENVQAYGIVIEDYFRYKETRQSGFQIYAFPKNTHGLILELTSWNEALVLVGEKIFIISLFFIKPISIEKVITSDNTFLSCSLIMSSSVDTD